MTKKGEHPKGEHCSSKEKHGVTKLSTEAPPPMRKLSQELKSLREQRDSLSIEAEQWAEERDRIHKQIKDLRLEAASLRERRDKVNAKVKTLKTQRNQMRALIKEKLEKTKQIREKLQLLNMKKPRQSVDAIRKEKAGIEWKIQTTPLTLQEEKPLVRKANLLELQLNICQKIDDANEKIVKLRKEIAEMSEGANLSHSQLSESARQSQELHETMMKTLERTKMLQTEADAHHQNFIQSKQKAQKMHREFLQVKEKVMVLEEESMKSKESEKMLRDEEARNKLKAEVLKKLKEGKKLTFEEFKLTSEDTS
jgi:uncharacterized coiled-coil DUF342 family protein